MKKSLLILALTVSFGQLSAQKGTSWTKVGPQKAAGLETIRETYPDEGTRLYQINTDQLKQSLQNAADRLSGQPGIEIQIPNTEGAMERFLVWENSNFAPELQAQFPEIRAYVGKGVTDATATLHFSLSPAGIQTMILRADKGSEFIEPYTKDHSIYLAFDSKTRRLGTLPLNCTTEDVQLANDLGRGAATALANNGLLKTMRLALSCTGEYTVYHGGTVAGALSAMNATMTRCNGVFEKDFAVHLNLIANNNIIVYTNAATDPYSNAASMNNWNGELQANLNSTIGAANYDIGHLFGATGGGGNAGCIGCVCVDNSKGSGITSPADGIPMGDNFDIDYVAHEMGHQMGGNHTFSHSGENNSVNVEPGSGSTIMGYAGITGATDVQAHSDDYFTYRSILQVQSNLATKACPVTVAMTNQTPTVNAGADYTIPKGTAFKLTGTGSDPDGTPLMYAWEENDDATIVGGASSYPSGTKTNGPNFRSLPAVSEPVRYFPAFSTVLGGSLSSTWEATSTVARTLNFTLTAWDNFAGGGQTNTDAMIVTVNGTAGPFTVTSPTLNQSWVQNATQSITWNVAGTTANGVNTANVNILFSSDNGATWSTLLANTPNDGSENITVPNIAAAHCRILIEAVGNVFYAVSPSFAVGYTISTTCSTYTNNTPLVVPDGSGSNAFGPTVTSNINVTESGTISDVNATINGSHTYFWDLEVKLVHPDATGDILFFRQCNQPSGAYNVTLNDGAPTIACGASGSAVSGTYNPYSPLSVFNGKQSNGTWQLQVRDSWQGDTGTINSWAIEICREVATLTAQSFGLADFVLYPNPNSGNFTVQFTPSTTQDVHVMVNDMRGRQIFEKKYANAGIFEQNIQLSNVQSGVYLVTVQEGDKKEVKKIVIN